MVMKMVENGRCVRKILEGLVRIHPTPAAMSKLGKFLLLPPSPPKMNQTFLGGHKKNLCLSPKDSGT